MRNERNARQSPTRKPQRQRCGQKSDFVVKKPHLHFQVMNAVRDDRQRVAARVERERSAREQDGAAQAEAEADDPEPPVAEMSNLEINQ